MDLLLVALIVFRVRVSIGIKKNTVGAGEK